MERKEIPLWEKYLLTIEEAAIYFNVGEHKLRALASNDIRCDCFISVGAKLLVNKNKFEKYLDNLRYI